MFLSFGLPALALGQRGLVRVDEHRTAGAVDYGNVTVISRVEGVADTGDGGQAHRARQNRGVRVR